MLQGASAMDIYTPSLEYYVYAYLREDGSPYYIGKGKRKRYLHSKNDRIKPPKDQSRIIICESGLTNIGACAIERRLIRWYGRKSDNSGILLNITEGGEGNTSPRTAHWIENHSRLLQGKQLTKEHIDKIKTMDRSYMQTKSYKEKVSSSKKGVSNTKLINREFTDETRKKLSLAQKKRLSDSKNHPMFGKKHSEDTKKKISKTKKLKTFQV
jgi:hypothetical protein